MTKQREKDPYTGAGPDDTPRDYSRWRSRTIIDRFTVRTFIEYMWSLDLDHFVHLPDGDVL